jgi:hypothetical protein
MISKVLSNGTTQHTLDGWVGLQQPGEPMTKTKWRKTDSEYWEINGYTLTRNKMGNITCECKGYIFRKKCRHITEVKHSLLQTVTI